MVYVRLIRIQEGKNYLQKKKKGEEISGFDVLDVLFGRLEASDGCTEILHKGDCLLLMGQILSFKTWIRIRFSEYGDPQHWFYHRRKS
jgi:hypothetical protein